MRGLKMIKSTYRNKKIDVYIYCGEIMQVHERKKDGSFWVAQLTKPMVSTINKRVFTGD